MSNTLEKNQSDRKIIYDRVMESVKDFLSPEILNRLDHTIVFKSLSKETLLHIFRSKIDLFLTTRKTKVNVSVDDYTDEQLRLIIEEIYDPQYGARPIERYIHNTIEPLLIQKIMES